MSGSNAATTLYLVRHGATAHNEARPVILQGCGVDGPLSPRGLEQAADVAAALASFRVAAVYCSPLQRARQTAAEIAERHAAPVQPVPELHEVDVGDWEGLSWAEIMERDPEHYEQFMADPNRVGYRNGESYRDVLNRILPVFNGLWTTHAGESFVIVAHNVVNRVLLAHLLDLAHPRTLRQDNCCINVIRRKHERTEVHTINAVFHLREQ